MICITGDVHHASMKTGDQRVSSVGIEKVAKKYVKIAAKYDIQTTLFVTGKFCEELSEPDSINKSNVEIGGHTWSAFRPKWLFGLFSRLFNARYGPRLYQRRDIKKTIAAIESTFGSVATSWRTHAYNSNAITLDELSKTSVKIVSDEVSPTKRGPHKIRQNLCSLPINVLPDHEHIYHGARTREAVAKEKAKNRRDAFTSESYPIRDYYNHICDQIDRHINNNGIATLLLHPICMQVADEFEMFEQLCQRIASQDIKTIKSTAVVNR